MVIYYIYVKTHLITGLKYLGFTERNPYVYNGSGKHWKRHIAKHGKHIWTNVVFQSETKEQIKEIGLYFSNLWNVVESKNWANMKPEEGDGGSISHTETAKNKMKKPKTEEHKAKLRGPRPQSRKPRPEHVKLKISNSHKNKIKSPEHRAAIAAAQLGKKRGPYGPRLKS